MTSGEESILPGMMDRRADPAGKTLKTLHTPQNACDAKPQTRVTQNHKPAGEESTLPGMMDRGIDPAAFLRSPMCPTSSI